MEYRDQRPGYRRGVVPRERYVEALVLGRARSRPDKRKHWNQCSSGTWHHRIAFGVVWYENLSRKLRFRH